jgi:hypothetical protein
MDAMLTGTRELVRWPSRGAIWLAAALIGGAALVCFVVLWRGSGLAYQAPGRRSPRLVDIPFDGAAAYEHLRRICQLGPRPSGSSGMQAQQKLLTEYFETLGGRVTLDRFRYRSPLDGHPVDMANLIVSWHPERKERILLCTHYDTRPLPDRDPENPRGTFLGANDGASGVALLMELGKAMPGLGGPLGVDFVFFDGEEYVFRDDDPYFIGSEWFARQYVEHPPAHRYRAAVLLDMVGDADLQIFQERNSLWWPEARPLVEQIWRTAARLGVREFIARPKHEIRDDHLKLYHIAKIPACDIIDFDYAYWHTEGDAPSQCSALSLAKVGWVITEWLKTQVH